MVISLKMALEDDIEGKAGSGTKRTIDKIQAHLPDNPRNIQINNIIRVTKNFNCKSACDGRTYEYLLPTFSFHQATKLPPPSRDNADVSKENLTVNPILDSNEDSARNNQHRHKEIFSEVWSSE